MKSDVFLKELETVKATVDDALNRALLRTEAPYETLLDAMQYSLVAGGKRIRAIICIKFCEALGGSLKDALPAACAIEMLHTYTLIHDDLPCMDDDNMRRGKPSNHIAFGESTAVLAGHALQAYAFETVLKSALPPEIVVKMAQILAENSGAHGVCGGQYLDLSSAGDQLTLVQILKIYSKKTSAMISAAAQMGVLAGGGTAAQALAAGRYAMSVGLAFQIKDDILDCIATEAKLGKPIGSDAENGKTTLMSRLGIAQCEELVEVETENALEVLDEHFEDAAFLKSLASYLAGRSC